MYLENNISQANDYIKNHPDKPAALESLLNEVIEILDNVDGDVDKAQVLLDFAITHGADNLKPLIVKYIQLKVLLYQGMDDAALKHYQEYIPSNYPLTVNEYFRLGTAMQKTLANIKGEKEKNKGYDECLDLFYQSYNSAEKINDKKSMADAKNLMTKLFTHNQNKGKDSVCFFNEKSDNAKKIFNAYIKTRRTKLLKTMNKATINILIGFRFAREYALQPTSELNFFGGKQETPPELVLIDKIIKDLQEGKGLEDKMKDELFVKQLKNHELLHKLVVTKLLPSKQKKNGDNDNSVPVRKSNSTS